MRWADYVAHVEEMRGEERYIQGIYRWGGLREGDHVGDPSVGGSFILRWIYRKCTYIYIYIYIYRYFAIADIDLYCTIDCK
jgi:hypothetical protein